MAARETGPGPFRNSLGNHANDQTAGRDREWLNTSWR